MNKYIIVIFLVIFLCGCEVNNNVQVISYNHTIQNSTCKWLITDNGYLPDKDCSPGDVFPLTTIQINGNYAEEPGGVIVGDICVSGYSANIRDVSQKTKDFIYKEYGVISHETGEYEIDHIIPLAIGGTNDVRNLFPQPALPKPGFHQKDVCESCFKRMICNRQLDIQVAQDIMANNWIECLMMCNVKW